MNVETCKTHTLHEYYLTDVLPYLCIWNNYHDDGLAVYSVSPLAQIEILANKQTRTTGAAGLQFIRESVRLFYVCTLTLVGSFTTVW